MDYFKEKERRKLNIKVNGVSESKKREPGDRKEDYTQMVKKNFFRELGVEAEIENFTRLGRVVENKN